MDSASFYIRMFTRAGARPDDAAAKAQSVFRAVAAVEPSTLIEPYDKLGLYANRITVSAKLDEATALVLFDAFLALADAGWAFIPFDEKWTAREAAWDERRTDEGLLDASVRGA